MASTVPQYLGSASLSLEQAVEFAIEVLRPEFFLVWPELSER